MNKNIVVVIALVLWGFSQNLYAQVKPLPSNIEATWGEGQNVKDGLFGLTDELNILGMQGDYVYAYREDRKRTGFSDKNLEKLSIEKYDKNTLALVETMDCELLGDGEKLEILLKVELIANKVIIIAASQKGGKQAIYGATFFLESKKVETTKLLVKREFNKNSFTSSKYKVNAIQNLSCIYENDFFLINYYTDVDAAWGNANQQLGFHLFDAQLNLVQEYIKPLNAQFLTEISLKTTPEGNVLWFCKQHLKDKKAFLSYDIKNFIDEKPNYQFALIEYKKDKEPAIYSISASEGEKYLVANNILSYVNDTHIKFAGIYDILDENGKPTSESNNENRNEYGLFSITIEKKTSSVVKKAFIPAKGILPPIYNKKREDYLKGRFSFQPNIYNILEQQDSSLVYVMQLEGNYIELVSGSRNRPTPTYCARDLVVCKISSNGQVVWKSIIEKLNIDNLPSFYAHKPKIITKDNKMYYVYNNVTTNFEKKTGEELTSFASGKDNCVAIAEIDMTSGETNKYILTPQTEDMCIFLNSPKMVLQTSPTSWTLIGGDKKGYRLGKLSIK